MWSSRRTMTVAVSAGILAAAAAVLATVAPGAAAFFSDAIPVAYGAMRTWLTPPYLYFVINGIIISIAASSRFHKPSDDPPPVVRQEIITPAEYGILKLDQPEEEPPPPPIFVVAAAAAEYEPDPVVPESPPEPAAPPAEPAVAEEEFVISRSNWTPSRRESHQISTEPPALPQEKPLVSARFGRRGAKASPDGKAALGVSRPKKGETLESTWKAITDGRAVPLARHLKKSDTWGAAEHHGRGRPDESPAGPEPVMRKSETFKEQRGGGGGWMPPPVSPSSSGRLRREASLGQDDLNRRVEAFIKKFNEEMRLQRQESYQQYLEMIDSGGGGGGR